MILACPKKASGGITEDDRAILKMIERDVLSIDPELDRDDDGFRLAVLVIAAGFIAGPAVEPLVELTGYPRQLVNGACNNMRAADLWTDDSMVAEWLTEDRKYAKAILSIYTLVAEGLLIAKQDPERGRVYQTVQPQ